MTASLSEESLDVLFRKARTYSAWLPKPVTDETIRQIYDLMKWGPTSANSCPARFFFITTKEAKERLKRALSPGNVDKTMAAPATVIVAYDLKFYQKLSKLFPQNPAMTQLFEQNPQLVESTARRNSSLQGAYLMIAARALGLDCGPMSGFDNAILDEEFFGAAKQSEGGDQEFFSEGQLKSNFLCNLGYGDPARLHPRNPRLSFEEACRFL
ncbi:MAG TPA: malonic semialdehyde reductase [Patescibacteria group bacterium]|jgi:3-hydroxypropanoate dehydrogenase|nr:malonic semialdehyde reductase [Patescibacteria group bacterium]